MKKKESTVIVLLATKDGNRAEPVPGTTVVVADCGHQAYVAPATVTMLADKSRTCLTVCDVCIDSRLSDRTLEKYFVPGSKEEMTSWLGVARADQIIAAARDAGVQDL